MISILMAIDYLDDEEQKRFVEDLYDKYSALILKVAYEHVHDYDTAQDILNDTFIKIIKYVDTIQNLKEFQILCYIKQTAYSAAANYFSKESVEKKKVEKWILENEPVTEVTLEGEEIIRRVDLQNLLRKCMNQLDERDRMLLISKYGLNMKYTEIAEEYSIAHGNISSFVKRARNRFKNIVRKETGNE